MFAYKFIVVSILLHTCVARSWPGSRDMRLEYGRGNVFENTDRHEQVPPSHSRNARKIPGTPLMALEKMHGAIIDDIPIALDDQKTVADESRFPAGKMSGPSFKRDVQPAYSPFESEDQKQRAFMLDAQGLRTRYRDPRRAMQEKTSSNDDKTPIALENEILAATIPSSTFVRDMSQDSSEHSHNVQSANDHFESGDRKKTAFTLDAEGLRTRYREPRRARGEKTAPNDKMPIAHMNEILAATIPSSTFVRDMSQDSRQHSHNAQSAYGHFESENRKKQAFMLDAEGLRTRYREPRRAMAEKTALNDKTPIAHENEINAATIPLSTFVRDMSQDLREQSDNAQAAYGHFESEDQKKQAFMLDAEGLRTRYREPRRGMAEKTLSNNDKMPITHENEILAETIPSSTFVRDMSQDSSDHSHNAQAAYGRFESENRKKQAFVLNAEGLRTRYREPRKAMAEKTSSNNDKMSITHENEILAATIPSSTFVRDTSQDSSEHSHNAGLKRPAYTFCTSTFVGQDDVNRHGKVQRAATMANSIVDMPITRKDGVSAPAASKASGKIISVNDQRLHDAVLTPNFRPDTHSELHRKSPLERQEQRKQTATDGDWVPRTGQGESKQVSARTNNDEKTPIVHDDPKERINVEFNTYKRDEKSPLERRQQRMQTLTSTHEDWVPRTQQGESRQAAATAGNAEKMPIVHYDPKERINVDLMSNKREEKSPPERREHRKQTATHEDWVPRTRHGESKQVATRTRNAEKTPIVYDGPKKRINVAVATNKRDETPTQHDGQLLVENRADESNGQLTPGTNDEDESAEVGETYQDNNEDGAAIEISEEENIDHNGIRQDIYYDMYDRYEDWNSHANKEPTEPQVYGASDRQLDYIMKREQFNVLMMKDHTARVWWACFFIVFVCVALVIVLFCINCTYVVYELILFCVTLFFVVWLIVYIIEPYQC